MGNDIYAEVMDLSTKIGEVMGQVGAAKSLKNDPQQVA